MAKRMLDCYASDFQKFTKEDLLESILKSEGRIIACETIGTLQPMLGNVTNVPGAQSHRGECKAGGGDGGGSDSADRESGDGRQQSGYH